MTERQERITMDRVQDAGIAESQARMINRLGGWRAFKSSLPARATVVGETGLWSTVRRSVTPQEQKMIDALTAEPA